MAKKDKNTGPGANKGPAPAGYPHYPEKDDIYNKEKKDDSIDPDDKSKIKKQPKAALDEDELDIPGAELDDADEEIGEEDEENNYYSLGGDNHEDLEEDKGD